MSSASGEPCLSECVHSAEPEEEEVREGITSDMQNMRLKMIYNRVGPKTIHRYLPRSIENHENKLMGYRLSQTEHIGRLALQCMNLYSEV